VNPAWARDVAAAALRDRGVPDTDAASVAEVLTETSLAGIATHGLRLLATYLDELDRGTANPRPQIKPITDQGAILLLDADDALGVVAGLHAASLAVERAREHGLALAGVRRSNHFGAAGAYAGRIAAAGLLGMVSTSAAARVAPFGGVEPLLGTNPLAVAYGPDFRLDMATSQVCYHQIKERAKHDETLEPGWATNGAGEPCTVAREAHALSPLGGYKGQGLGMVVTLLTAGLMGGPADWELTHVGQSDRGRDVCHFLLAVNPDALGGAEHMNRLCTDLVRTTRSAREQVLVPGDPQRQHRARQERHGLELDQATRDLLVDLAQRYDVR
jgi:ureidoglycolate dehydrogenase (NAD+)